MVLESKRERVKLLKSGLTGTQIEDAYIYLNDFQVFRLADRMKQQRQDEADLIQAEADLIQAEADSDNERQAEEQYYSDLAMHEVEEQAQQAQYEEDTGDGYEP